MDFVEICTGLCQCGCGERTTIATMTSRRDGTVKGQPKRYITNHHKRLSSVEYLIEDKGYKTPCWIWQRSKESSGYGQAYREGKIVLAHIAYWKEKNGSVPKGKELHHKCKIRACCNPDHVIPLIHKQHSRIGGMAKLNQEDVDKIRNLSHLPRKSLAKRFGVSGATIYMILSNKTWI